MARVISFVVLVAILLVMGVLFFQVMAGFFVPLFLALLLVVMFQPVHRLIVVRARGRERLAALLTTLAILTIVMAPLLLVLIQAGFEASAIAQRWNTAAVRDKLSSLRDKTGLALPPHDIMAGLEEVGERLDACAASNLAPDCLRKLSAAIDGLAATLDHELAALRQSPPWSATGDLERLRDDRQRLLAANAIEEVGGRLAEVNERFDALRADLLGTSWKIWLKRQANPSPEQLAVWRTRAREFADSLAVGGAQYAGNVLPDLLIGLAVMIVALYYFLADGPAMIKALMALSPLDDCYEEQLFREFATVSRAVVVASLLSALVQGILAGFGYFFAGIGSVALLTMLTMVLSLVPFVGATAVWIPCCLWLFLEGRLPAAVVLAIYCAAVVSTADNVIKPLVLRGQSNMHPLLALLSVLGGVKALGPIGILVGPMVVAFLHALLKMVQVEMNQLRATP
ncbi:MAG TPA: AI-2E family transporter [Pirellulales bacterium]